MDIDTLIEESYNFVWEKLPKQIVGTTIYYFRSPEYYTWINNIRIFLTNNLPHDNLLLKDFENIIADKKNGLTEYKYNINYNQIVGIIKSCKNANISNIDAQNNSIVILENIFNNLPKAIRQLRNRHKGRTQFIINDEYDLQDLIHSILKLFFEDVRPEEHVPSVAGGASRIDFLLKKEKIAIEVKMTRYGLADKELGKQFIEDITKYKGHQDCKYLIFFTYDPENRINNHKAIEEDLLNENIGIPIKLIIAP